MFNVDCTRLYITFYTLNNVYKSENRKQRQLFLTQIKTDANVDGNIVDAYLRMRALVVPSLIGVMTLL